MSDKTFKWLMLGDLQIPYHDKRAVDLVFKVIKKWNPDAIDIVGDVDDQLEYSRFSDGTTDEFFSVLNKMKMNEDETPEAFAERKSPLSFIRQNSSGTREFFHQLRQVSTESDIHFTKGNHECFRWDTKIVTKEGFKSRSELKKGDLVLSTDESGKAIWTPILDFVDKPDYRGEMYEASSQRYSMSVTPGHRMMRLKQSGKLDNEIVAKEFFSLKSPGRIVTAVNNDAEDFGGVSDNEIRLWVWSMTDAHKNGNKTTFHQAASKVYRIRELLEEEGIEYRERSRQRDITEICGKKLKSKPQVIHELTVSNDALLDYSKNEFPDWAFKLSERQVKVLLEEWQFTDGTKPTGGSSIVLYASTELYRENLMLICTLNGYSATQTEYRSGHWRLNITKRNSTRIEFKELIEPVSNVTPEGVYCLVVKEGRFFVATDKGVHLTGNCRVWSYVDRKLPQYNEYITSNFLWDLDDLGITHRAYELPPLKRFGDIYVHHGNTTTTTGLAVKNDIENYNISLVRGHDHRGGVVYKTYPMTGQTLVGMGTGHLCNPSAYGLRYTTNPAWELGFGIGHVYNGVASLQFIPIQNSSDGYFCVVDGMVIKE